MPLHSETLRWIRHELASEAAVGSHLAGGVTSQVYALAGGRFVVKQVSDANWLQERPDVVEYEARVLEWLADAPVPVPQVVAVDPDGSHAGYPTLLMTAMPGRAAGHAAAPATWMSELASLSACILSLEAPAWVRPFTRYQPPTAAAVPAWAADPDVWHWAIGVISGSAPPAAERVIHRDFHPWNVLWDDRITAVVDWSQTSIGPAQMDAAHCRANLAIGFDAETADDYRVAWERATGLDHDPYFDIVTCIDFLPDWRPSGRGNRRLEAWLGRVVAEAAD